MCVSGIPNDKTLKSGDIVNIDVTVIRDGFTVTPAACISLAAHPACTAADRTCWEAMWRGIEQVKRCKAR